MPISKVLLLNGSNLPTFPVYPYAFIQVPAAARQFGIQVVSHDLLGTPQEAWGSLVQEQVEQHDPAMILVTLRNTDSLIAREYEPAYEENGNRAYFPIHNTHALVQEIRKVTGVKIALGGFGFSVMPEAIMEFVRPDIGVFGGAAPFFEHFDKITASEFSGVPNLLYFQGGKLVSNPRVFSPPLNTPEYTPAGIKDMLSFYEKFPKPGFLGAPIEVMRGCCHTCVFCCEPHVGGFKVQYRDLSAILQDIETIVEGGITRLYMISSELNPEGNRFALDLADLIWAFNERQPPERQVTWFGANYLLGFSAEEYDRLYRSGFTGGWFDITALDDDNARAMRTPYRNRTLIGNLKTFTQVQYKQFTRMHVDETFKKKTNGEGSAAFSLHWTLFMGNPATTLQTIRRTLRAAHQAGLDRQFTSCGVNSHIRVFDYEHPDDATLAVTYSVHPGLERAAYNPLYPSFAYPPALLDHFGSEQAVQELFRLIGETYLSRHYQTTREWGRFLRDTVSRQQVAAWLEVLPQSDAPLETVAEQDGLAALFSEAGPDSPENSDEKVHSFASALVDRLLEAAVVAHGDAFQQAGLPANPAELAACTPYQLAFEVYSRWPSAAEFEAASAGWAHSSPDPLPEGLLLFSLKALLHRFNLPTDPAYRALFVDGH
jgi:hypothetical protein